MLQLLCNFGKRGNSLTNIEICRRSTTLKLIRKPGDDTWDQFDSEVIVISVLPLELGNLDEQVANIFIVCCELNWISFYLCPKFPLEVRSKVKISVILDICLDI
jgi:hypothetical protein